MMNVKTGYPDRKRSAKPPNAHWSLFRLIVADLRRKATWCYEDDRVSNLVKVLLTDGTPAMILYRLMQQSRRSRIEPLAMLFNKLNTLFCHCVIGRGAEFGPGLVLVHASGIVINGQVVGGENVVIEHQVTIGAERRRAPRLGSDIFLGAGAKVIGAVSVGDGARVGANAVVVHDVPPQSTVVGIPARVVRKRPPPGDPDGDALAATIAGPAWGDRGVRDPYDADLGVDAHDFTSDFP